jgi:outer membrane protein assembly factor BamB
MKYRGAAPGGSPLARNSFRLLIADRARAWVAVMLLIPAAALCTDWPQFLGPNRDGVYPGDDVTGSFPAGGPPVVWKKNVGAGFSNPVVANGRLILFHRQGGKEVVEALDAATGKPIWKFDYSTSYRDDFGFDEGPRAAPVVAGGQVYTFGAEGMLHCLQFAGGGKIWSLDTHREFGVNKGFFGAAGAPLVEGTRIFLNVGGKSGAGLVALDKDTGRLMWKASNDEASYSSPIIATFGGKPHLLALTRAGLLGADPASGEIYFQFPWRARSQASVNAATPLVIGDLIFLSASYGTGAAVLRVNGSQLEKLWSGDDSLTNHYSTSVHYDGNLYGYHGRQEYGQSFRAVELRTGKVRWSEDGFGAGTVTLAGNRLLLMRENGELVIARAAPERFEPLSRAQILPGTVRAYPAIANGLLYVRNGNTLVCLRLGK